MSITSISPYVSRVRLGIARVDMTPPPGIHHGIWGAAPPHAAADIHRPHYADILIFRPADNTSDGPGWLVAHLDLVGLPAPQHEEIRSRLSVASGTPLSHTVITYSHTHATANLSLDRLDLPGGDKIPGFLATLSEKVAQAGQEVTSAIQDVVITYATGRCNMANNRDYWDDASGLYACGFNPATQGDDTVLVARVTNEGAEHVATIVNYGCHPTTLAWENWINSPDYPGAMRTLVEDVSGAPCVFALSACGDMGPRHGFVGDPAVADQNGRWLGYSVLAALESMGPPAHRYVYGGPVISGATLGTWRYEPLDADAVAQAAELRGGQHSVDLPLKPLPKRAKLQAELDEWLARKANAQATGDDVAARDYGARAERARRWIGRVDNLPSEGSYPYHFSVFRLGSAVWVYCGGEPYSLLQVELRRRFPRLAIMVSPLAGDLAVAYLLPQERYGKGLYQEEPSILAPGCLETVIEAIARQIEKLI